MTEIEKDYSAVVKEINSKLAEAGKLILEANNLSKTTFKLSIAGTFFDNLDEAEGIDMYLLFSALNKAGWNTSSMTC